jgi:hypothetical protein
MSKINSKEHHLNLVDKKFNPLESSIPTLLQMHHIKQDSSALQTTIAPPKLQKLHNRIEQDPKQTKLIQRPKNDTARLPNCAKNRA